MKNYDKLKSPEAGDDELDAILAQLSAAHVAQLLFTLARKQHQVNVILLGERRKKLLPHLRGLGIDDAAAKACMGERLDKTAIERLGEAAKKIDAWEKPLTYRVRSAIVGNKT